MDMVGRWAFVTGTAGIVVVSTASHYLNAWSAMAWLVEWVGLAILLRREGSPIVSIGGGFLVSCVCMMAAIGIGQLLGAAFSII